MAGGAGMAGGAAPSAGGTAGAPSGGDVSSAGTAGVAMTGGQTSTGGTATGGGAGGTGGTAGSGGVANVAGSGSAVDPALLPKITLHLAGDSTVMTYAANSAQEGWGQELGQFFNAKLSIDNQAIGGASVETFYTGRWQNIVGALKAGDYVMAAFGANDSGSVAGRHVDPPAYQARFSKMGDEVAAKQATFILVTPSALQQWSGGKETNTRLGPYVDVLHALATSKPLALADLNARGVEFLNVIGQAAAAEIYINGDKAHFTKKGATQMATFVANEVTRIASPLAAYRQ
jgi:lysophospholipase L1-like esterase